MANRFPLIVDTSDNNKIKELPSGDNLNLSGSGIVNAASIAVNGTLSAQSITVNGTSLSTVATTGDYNDLLNTPIAFSGSYNDLTNRPTIPTSTRTLNDVQNIEPSDGDALIYNSVAGRYEPTPITTTLNLGSYNLDALNNVITPGDTTNKFLKYYSGAWRAANVTYAEVQSAPTKLSDLINDLVVSDFTNDAGYISSETDSQTLTLENGVLSITDGNSVNLATLDLKGGSVYAQDSSLLIDGISGKHFGTFEGRFDGDLNGGVFADNSVTVIDGLTGKVVGIVDNDEVTTGNLYTTAINMSDTSINSSNGVSVQTTGTNGITLGSTAAPINIDNSTANALNSINILSGSNLNIKSKNDIILQSGPDDGPYTDLTIRAENTTLSSGGGGGIITLGSTGDIISSQTAKAFVLPTYDSDAARNAALPSPEYGTLIYNTSVHRVQVYRFNGVSTEWANL